MLVKQTDLLPKIIPISKMVWTNVIN